MKSHLSKIALVSVIPAITALGGLGITAASADPVSDSNSYSELMQSREFVESVKRLGQDPERLAQEISSEVDAADIEYLIGTLEDTYVEDPIVTARTAIWNLKCGKAWSGYLLYQAQGFLVCAPASVVNPIAGGVCQAIKIAAGGAIDFNQLCD